MSRICKGQHSMAGRAEMGAYTQSIGHTSTISWTYQNGSCGSGAGHIPGAHFMISMQVRENNCLGRNIEFIGTESIKIKRVDFFGADKRFHNIERYSAEYSHCDYNTAHSTDHDLL